jgi:hypothetical protein
MEILYIILLILILFLEHIPLFMLRIVLYNELIPEFL